jgi:hypothetical protein
MRPSRPLLLLFSLVFVALFTATLFLCTTTEKAELDTIEKVIETLKPEDTSTQLDSLGATVEARFPCPAGYHRATVDQNSFAQYLRDLPLKPHSADVKYYNGEVKQNYAVYCAVVDMDLDPVDLQQCADAVMRLRGEYLFEQERYADIHFDFLSDSKPRYFKDYSKGDYSYRSFRKYMKYVFSYANTASLRNELRTRPMMDMHIGDVLIQKGRPYGHAVIVIDMCVNDDGVQLYMLAQSYMPAQDTQILTNPTDAGLSPWYTLADGEIRTPEWSFNASDLRYFDN